MIEQRRVPNYGRVDILVNNAGFLRDRSFAKMTPADFDAVVAVHLAGAAYCTMAAWARMREAGYGRIVFTTSNSGLFGNFGQANYAAGKAGLIGLMNVLKQEGGKYGITVNTLAPMAATPMTEAVMDDATKAAFDPALVSAALVYLCSDECTDSGRIVSTAGGTCFCRAGDEQPGRRPRQVPPARRRSPDTGAKSAISPAPGPSRRRRRKWLHPRAPAAA